MAKMILIASVLLLAACASTPRYPTVCTQPKPDTSAPQLAAAQIRADTPNDKAVVLLTQSLQTAAEYAKGLERFAESCKTRPKFRQSRKKAA
ncbi:hypothetical protein [Kingella oralis]|uniref:hypothetical protein n=1 Tax=Kingella oralis TaxID=505 RepID=UPI0034E4DB4C